MKSRGVLFLLIFALLSRSAFAFETQAQTQQGDIQIERSALGSKIEIRTFERFAGAVSSLVFRGQQYVNTRDHGRELQSAVSFDGLGECFNPTEAGNISDGGLSRSTSKLLGANKTGQSLEITVDMAFWLPPSYDYHHGCGSRSDVSHSVNKNERDGYLLSKRVEIGSGGIQNIVGYFVTYTIPEAHVSATFEAATVYTPIQFSKRYVLNIDKGNIENIETDGEQSFPVILATDDGLSAIGLYSPFLPQKNLGYGSFHFDDTNKINCVFRTGIVNPGEKRSFTCYFAVGTIAEVEAAILSLHEERLK